MKTLIIAIVMEHAALVLGRVVRPPSKPDLISTSHTMSKEEGGETKLDEAKTVTSLASLTCSDEGSLSAVWLQ